MNASFPARSFLVLRIAVAGLPVLLAACQQSPSPPASAPVTAKSAPAPAPARPAAPVAPPKIALPSTDFAPGPLYFCETGAGRTAIEYEPRVEQLCRRHPEMGPCQYERNACRKQKGRVYTAKGEEVTLAVEAEYDKAVTRVTFQGDAGAPPARKK
jgi:hypothetical protein